jgi:5-methylcytosine-specific restriction protein A
LQRPACFTCFSVAHFCRLILRSPPKKLGESLWAFTRRADGVYAIVAELIAKAKTLNQQNFRYGRYRVWGDLESSRYFSAGDQPDITTFIRALSVKAGGDVLGRAFQGHAAVREISQRDHDVLRAYASKLPHEPRARLIPEERLEALLLAGDEDAVERLVLAEGAGLADERRRYLYGQAARRDARLYEELRTLYRGVCQVSGWDPRREYGVDLCEAHHVRWLSRGGKDHIGNMVLVAPNVHRALHRLDAPFDFSRTAFVVPSGEISLRLAKHELVSD